VNPAHQRAKPLAPDDRRRAIVEAVIPLLLEKGSTLTSKEMAEAAGVAEGTIFSVFPDKPAVIVEAVKLTMDPTPFRVAIAEVSPAAPLEDQLTSVATVLLERSERIGTLVGVLRTLQPTGPKKPAEAHRFVMESNAAIVAALTDLFERHSDDLRVDPGRAAVAFMGYIFANAHPLLPTGTKSDTGDFVDMLLHGIAAPDGEATT
jgi:AcrR family transcriptional regulator